MMYVVEIGVYGKVTMTVSATCYADAETIALENLDHNEVEYEYEVLEIYPDHEE